MEETVIDSWNAAEAGEEGLYLVRAELRFAPTLFKYWRYRVLHPSPTRFLLSLAKDVYEIWGADLRRSLGKVKSEVLSHSVRTERLYIGRGAGNGRERYIECFAGDATFVFETPATVVPVLLSLLRLSGAIGVGKNRPLGLGFVSVANVEVEKVSKNKKAPEKSRK